MLVDAVNEGTRFPLLDVILDMIIQTLQTSESLVLAANPTEILTKA